MKPEVIEHIKEMCRKDIVSFVRIVYGVKLNSAQQYYLRKLQQCNLNKNSIILRRR